jgi:predicted nucleotidyltransferase
MKTAAIIAEYNPFHCGHAWQVQAIRQKFGDDCAILAVMSGCFTQRGEPSLLDKWDRTRMALLNGVNLVIELPFAYAAASAERFASGGVQLVQATGLNCSLVFGSESGDLDALGELARLLAEEPPLLREKLHQYLDSGESFPAARQQAVADLTGMPAMASLLESSNNILAIEYLKALYRLPDSRLTPVTFQRQGHSYNDRTLLDQAGGFASASAIRRRLSDFWVSGGTGIDGLVADLIPVMPAASLAVLMEKIQAGPWLGSLEDLALPLISQLRSLSPDQLDRIPGMSEGLGRRLAAAARRPGSEASPASGRMAVLLEDAATRRFPQTRIQRSLLAMLAGLQPEDLVLFDQAGGPQYLRVLGFDKQGRHLLKLMRRHATRPILMNASDSLEYKDPALVRMAELDSLATDIWMLAAGQPCGRDFDRPAVMR